jgi:hypothetical protein
MKELIIAYKLVWFRVSCYFLIPFITTFLALTETWSGDTWSETHVFLIMRILFASTLAGLISIVAFIDQSLDKAREKHQARVPHYAPEPDKETPTP